MGQRCEMHNGLDAVQLRHPIDIRSDIWDLDGMCALKLNRPTNNGSNIAPTLDRRRHEMPTDEPRRTSDN
jgi:hypothetical protein